MEQPAPWIYMGLVIESGRIPQQAGQVTVNAIIEWVVAFSQEEAEQIFRARLVKREGGFSNLQGPVEFLICPLPTAFRNVDGDPASNVGAYRVQLVPFVPDEDVLPDMQG